MLTKVKKLQGYKLHATDGFIGHVDELFFDDLHWTIRYLVADTGTWLTGRQVLLSPYALVKIDEKDKSIVVNLRKDQIENAPSLETDKPISRKFEEDYYNYFEWPLYWAGPDAWGYNPYIDRSFKKQDERPDKTWDAHLLSTHDVTGYRIQATDGEIGHVTDFIIADSTWTIHHLIVDTNIWWPGKHVLISPKDISRIDTDAEKVFVNLTLEKIKGLEHKE